ncbi:hypothetical protein EAE89_06255 [Photorhabdus heterorhabditis]|nr:hypothetical protein [Photorhabdus heterorhabditis]
MARCADGHNRVNCLLVSDQKEVILAISFIFQVAALLAAFTYLSHIVIYAPGDVFTCRRAAN